jgi:hypothetical protein
MQRMSYVSKDIEAEVTFFSQQEGGRNIPIFPGYRPTFIYDGSYWDASLWFDGPTFLPTGDAVTIYFGFSRPKQHLGKLVPGKEFELWDGRVIAVGHVIRVVDLEKSAQE